MRFSVLVLVVLMLLLFIGWRNALFAALGIPVAFMATFWFMSIAGYTLSGVSLFGLILVVGIVVDDAIVVIENIYRHIESGVSPKVAAIRGAEEVGWPCCSGKFDDNLCFWTVDVYVWCYCDSLCGSCRLWRFWC